MSKNQWSHNLRESNSAMDISLMSTSMFCNTTQTVIPTLTIEAPENDRDSKVPVNCRELSLTPRITSPIPVNLNQTALRTQAAQSDQRSDTALLSELLKNNEEIYPPSEVVFSGVWKENFTTHTILFRFDTVQQRSFVSIENSLKSLNIAIYRRNSQPVEVWDLHSGAVLEILGRSTTLQDPTAETSKWIDAQASFLKKQRYILLERLRKKNGYVKLLNTHPHGSMCHPDSERSAACCLRSLIDQLHALHEALSQVTKIERTGEM